MFDAIGAFKRQFTRVDGGYLVYPSRKLGGKLVSDDEYEQLVEGWKQVAGRSGQWKGIGVVVAVIVLWTLLADVISIPAWGRTLFITVIVLATSAFTLRASTAPGRLVKDRPPISPPRAAAEAQQDARAALNWPFVAFALIISGTVFCSNVNATGRTFGALAWLIGSGLMLGLYIWIAFRKLTDRRR